MRRCIYKYRMGLDVLSSVQYGSAGRVTRVVARRSRLSGSSFKATINAGVRITSAAISLGGGALPEDAMWDGARHDWRVSRQWLVLRLLGWCGFCKQGPRLTTERR